MTDRHAQKDALLLASLEHVAFDGWSRQALAAVARDLEMEPATARRLFPRGSESMLDAFDDWADRQMLAKLEGEDLERLRTRDRIAAAVRARIEVLTPYREATRRALAARSLPNTAAGGFQNLWRTVDRMWLAAGDTKADGFSLYSKRATLAAIYVATVLYWLEDTSLDQEDTWAFLDRRIDGVMRVQTLRERADRMRRRLPFGRRPYWSQGASV